MDVAVGQTSQIGRVTALSADGMRMWISLAEGGTVTVDSKEAPFDWRVGTVCLLRHEDNYLEEAPPDVWPPDSGETRSGGLWIGVVKLRLDDITVVDSGGRWNRIPTNSDLPYEVGNTVEGTDALGITRVLARDPLRYVEREDLGDDVIDAFLVTPSAELSFDDFGGLPRVVARARELIELPLQRREKLSRIGAGPVKGVLFTGLPGTGKTMLARIIAREVGSAFYAISGPTIFSKWYGESEEILRRIFLHAARNGPSIVFFDEIDSVAGRRTEDAHEGSKRVVAQLLTLMDGLSADENVTVIAATNRPQDIDEALRRPGRFDWQIDFPLPDPNDRESILQVHARRLATVDPLPHAWVAANSEGWSAAELAAIWKEASLLAVADDRDRILAEDYVDGYQRVAAQRRLVLAGTQVYGQ